MKKTIPLFAFIAFFCVSFTAFSNNKNSGNISFKPDISFQSQEEPELKVEIYPNPLTEGRLTVKANEQILSIQVLNITGEIVLNTEYQPGTYDVVLELNQAEKGLYLVRVNFDNKVIHTEKIMVK